jgi:nitrate/nitrite-specific signal transduction histidine kinase
MIAIYFIYGLAFFSLGLTVAMESRRKSDLPLGRQLGWLAAFGIVHAIVEWSDMLLLTNPGEPYYSILSITRTVLLPASTILLIRFGAGLIYDAGPLPRWLLYLPLILSVPAAILIGYAILSATADPIVATDVWTRYILYFTGCLLTSFGFMRQRRLLDGDRLKPARNLMLGAAIVFAINAIIAGLIVPKAEYGLAPWLNYESVMAVTGIPIQVWRMVSAVAVTLFVVHSLCVFEAERKHELERLQDKQEKAEKDLQEARDKAQIDRLTTQTEAREAAEGWANSLIDISRQIVNMEGVDSVLRHIVAQAQLISHSDCSFIGLLDEKGSSLEMKCHAVGTRIQSLEPNYKTEEPLLMEFLRSCMSHRFPEDSDTADITWHCPTLAKKLNAATIIPLQFDGHLIGGLWTGRTHERRYSLDEITILESLADQAVIAMQQAMMASRIQSLAVVEERTRIAREMHDGLAQVLGYLSLQMQTLEALTRQGDTIGVLNELERTRTNIKAAHADVRENILSLRTTLSGEAGVIPAIEEYVSEFGLQSSCDTHVTNSLEASPNISPYAEVQLVRIVQEALSNVRKHAHAGRVDVILSQNNGTLLVRIADDGVGFDSKSDRHQFGLQTMRERADSAGGILTVSSNSDEGTEIGLSLPLLPDERESSRTI